jgi:hypothetical protein
MSERLISDVETVPDQIIDTWSNMPSKDFIVYKSIPLVGSLSDALERSWALLRESVQDVFRLERRKSIASHPNLIELRMLARRYYCFRVHGDSCVTSVNAESAEIVPYVPYSVYAKLVLIKGIASIKCVRKHRCCVLSFTMDNQETSCMEGREILWHLYLPVSCDAYLYLETRNEEGKPLFLHKGIRLSDYSEKTFVSAMDSLYKASYKTYCQLSYSSSARSEWDILTMCDSSKLFYADDKTKSEIKKSLRGKSGTFTDPVFLMEHFLSRLVSERDYVFSLPKLSRLVPRVIAENILLTF